MTNATVVTTSAVNGNMTLTTNAGNAVPRLTIGIDLGDRHSHVCVLDSDGAIVEESRLQTTPTAFRQRFGGISPARIAIEAGTYSPWVHALLTELGHEVLVANPRRVRAIYSNDKKSDRVDAEQLARFAQMEARRTMSHLRGQGQRGDA